MHVNYTDLKYVCYLSNSYLKMKERSHLQETNIPTKSSCICVSKKNNLLNESCHRDLEVPVETDADVKRIRGCF